MTIGRVSSFTKTRSTNFGSSFQGQSQSAIISPPSFFLRGVCTNNKLYPTNLCQSFCHSNPKVTKYLKEKHVN